MTKKTKRVSINQDQPYQIGKCYLVRTVTNYIAGRIVCVGKNEIVVSDAAWIVDTGRFAEALKSALFSEVEPYPSGAHVIIGRGAVVDATQINPSGPFVQK